MKSLVLTLIMVGGLYLLYTYVTDYNTSLNQNVDTPAGFEGGGITTPIEHADSVLDDATSRYPYSRE